AGGVVRGGGEVGGEGGQSGGVGAPRHGAPVGGDRFRPCAHQRVQVAQRNQRGHVIGLARHHSPQHLDGSRRLVEAVAVHVGQSPKQRHAVLPPAGPPPPPQPRPPLPPPPPPLPPPP